MKEFRKRYWYEAALCASLVQLIYSPIAYTAETEEQLITADLLLASRSNSGGDGTGDTYTVNFNNISMIELIRFASKITNLNFVFEEVDLQFVVTVVSEEAVSAKNMMAAISQVLRMHDLMLLEQDGNVLITKSTKVNQIPPIVSADLPNSKADNAALVTRVFRIKNANVNTIAGIIRPMTSDGALIEVSVETRQLIVTDITTNVEQIAALLMSLDSPHSPLDVETYIVKNIAPADLITLTHQILEPFMEGNPLTFVPQADTNSIYIVSTPHLIERAMTVMEDLDIPPKHVVVGKQSLAGKDVFIYKVVNLTPSELIEELKQIAKKLKSEGGVSSPLETAIDSMQEVKDTYSLMFVADPDTTAKLKGLLEALDTPASGKTSFYVYKIQRAQEEQIAGSLNTMKNRLQASPHPDRLLIDAISSLKWVQETNSLIFTGSEAALKQLAGVLPTFDVSPSQARTDGQAEIKSTFLAYIPQHLPGEELRNELEDLEKNLQQSGLENPSFLATLGSMQWVLSANALLFTGDPNSIQRVEALLNAMDSLKQGEGALSQGFYLYKLQKAKCEEILVELKNVADKMPSNTLQNQNLVAALNGIECIESNNSLLITGTSDVIEQVNTLIAEFDSSGTQSFLVYKPKYLPAPELEGAVEDMAKNLQDSGLSDPQLFRVLGTMRYVPQTNSLIFTGSQEGLDKVQSLLSGIDTSGTLGAIQNIGNLTFLLYKIQAASPEKLISSLKTFATDLKQSNVEDKQLADSLKGVKGIKETNSLLFTGSTQTLERVEQLVKKFDIPALGGPTPIERAASIFIIYNPKYLSGDELISILCDFIQNLMASGVSDPGLFDTINNLKWIDKTSSLLVSGDQQSVDKVQQLLFKFDIPNKENAAPSIEAIDNTSFLVYKLRYHPGNRIQASLQRVAASLSEGTRPPTALVDAIHSMQWIQTTNSLLCSGQQDVLIKLKELIQNLDIPLRQVFIEVLVIETSLTNQQNFGLMWGSQLQYMNKTVLQTGNFPLSQSQGSSTPATTFPSNLQTINATKTPNNTLIPFSSGFDLGVIGDIIMHKGKSFLSLGSLMNALQLDTDSTILLNPKIITQDNRQSTIFVGQNLPYTGSLIQNLPSVATASNPGQVTANIEYRDVGVNLTITPILGDGEVITMDIVQDITETVGSSSSQKTSPTQLTGIQTSQAHMETRVHVPNNHFVALTGMIDNSKTHYRTAIPCLGGLPVIGFLFSEDDRTASKTNVIIFLRPQIINSYEEYQAITEHQEWLYKDNARLPVLKDEFDEGLNIVKPPENK